MSTLRALEMAKNNELHLLAAVVNFVLYAHVADKFYDLATKIEEPEHYDMAIALANLAYDIRNQFRDTLTPEQVDHAFDLYAEGFNPQCVQTVPKVG